MRTRRTAALLAGIIFALPALAQETRESMRERGWGKALADLAGTLDLTPGAVLDLEHDAASDVTSAWLGNGVRLHVRPTPEATNLVDATIVLAGGMLVESGPTRGLTVAAAQLANRGSLPGRSADESRQLLGAGGVRITVQGRTDAMVIRLRGDAMLLDGALAVVHELLSGVRLDAGQLAQWKRAQQSQLDAAGTSPAASITTLVWEAIYAGARAPWCPWTTTRSSGWTSTRPSAGSTHMPAKARWRLRSRATSTRARRFNWRRSSWARSRHGSASAHRRWPSAARPRC